MKNLYPWKKIKLALLFVLVAFISTAQNSLEHIASPTGFELGTRGGMPLHDPGYEGAEIEYNGNMYLRYRNNNNVYSLFKYDGTTLTEISSPAGYDNFGRGYHGDPIVFDGKLYLRYLANDGIASLFEYDGTNLTKITSPTGGLYYGSPILYNGNLYLRYHRSNHGILVVYENETLTEIPTPAGFNSSNAGYEGKSIVHNGKLYMKYKGADGNADLVIYDETQLTVIPSPVNFDGHSRGYTGWPIIYNGKLYLSYYTNNSNGVLFVYADTTLTEIPTPTAFGAANKGYRGFPIIFNNKIYLKYIANDGTGDLVEYNGTNFTALPTPLNHSYIGEPIIYDGKLYLHYVGTNSSQDLVGYDGTNFQTIANPVGFENPGYGYDDSPIVLKDKLYLRYKGNDGNSDLVEYDGSQLTVIPSSSGYDASWKGYFGNPFVFDESLYTKYQENTGNTDLTKLVICNTVPQESVAATVSSFSCSGSTTVTTGSSTNDFLYYLRNDADNVIVDGPLAGTGTGLSFNTGEITNTTTYNVYGGVSKTALQFAGAGEKVIIQNDTALEAPITTVEMWVRPDEESSTAQGLASMRDGTAGKSRWSLHMSVTGKTLGMYNGSGYATVATPTINIGQWYHVAYKMKAFGTEILMDGVSLGTISIGLSHSTTGKNLVIGSANDPNIPTERFTGAINDVRIWNVERTNAQILNAKDSCLLGTENNLVALYNFEDGSGTTLTDITDNGHNGTLNGMDDSDWITSNTICISCSSSEMLNTITVTANGIEDQGISETGHINVCRGSNYSFELHDSEAGVNYVFVNTSINNAIISTTFNATGGGGTFFDLQNLTVGGTFQVYAYNAADSANCNLLLPSTKLNVNIFGGAGVDTITACVSHTWIDGNTYTESNSIATHSLNGITGCDSTVTLNLTLNKVDTMVSRTGLLLEAQSSGATAYKWLDCDDNNAPIDGAISASYTVTSNGNYAVRVTENGCVDTSACIAITNLSVEENDLSFSMNVYPSPVQSHFYIEFDAVQNNTTVRTYNLIGKQLDQQLIHGTNKIQLNLNQPAGVYLLEITDSNKNRVTHKIVKE